MARCLLMTRLFPLASRELEIFEWFLHRSSVPRATNIVSVQSCQCAEAILRVVWCNAIPCMTASPLPRLCSNASRNHWLSLTFGSPCRSNKHCGLFSRQKEVLEGRRDDSGVRTGAKGSCGMLPSSTQQHERDSPGITAQGMGSETPLASAIRT